MLSTLDWTNHNLQSQNSGVTSIYPNSQPVTHLLVDTGDPYQGFHISAYHDGRDINNWGIGSSFSFDDLLKQQNDESWLTLGDLTLQNTNIIAIPLPTSTVLFASGLIFFFTRKKFIKS